MPTANTLSEGLDERFPKMHHVAALTDAAQNPKRGYRPLPGGGAFSIFSLVVTRQPICPQ